MIPRLIGISGKAGCGKDTLASHIVSCSPGHKVYSFAGPIKQMLSTLLGVSEHKWNDRKWKESTLPWLGVSPRYLAQTLGTEWGRAVVASDMWLRCAANFYTENADKLGGKFTGMVIPDVRFPNEAEWIHERGGVILQINRDVEAVEDHVSERGLPADMIDATIMNDMSVGVLCSRGYTALL